MIPATIVSIGVGGQKLVAYLKMRVNFWEILTKMWDCLPLFSPIGVDGGTSEVEFN